LKEPSPQAIEVLDSRLFDGLDFYDTSKKGTRRWCSMKMCGNRAKVAAWTERHRDDKRKA